MITKFELGWIVGLLEGEGHFGYLSNTPNVSVRMTDEDSLVKAANILSKIIGKQVIVRQLSPQGTQIKDVYYLQLYGNNARIVMRTVVKHMGWRRRQQIWQALNKYRPKKSTIDIVSLLEGFNANNQN